MDSAWKTAIAIPGSKVLARVETEPAIRNQKPGAAEAAKPTTIAAGKEVSWPVRQSR
jgi:hypothetical protein